MIETTEAPAMTDYERMQARDAARAAEMKALFHAIARAMPDWTIRQDAEPENTWRAYVLENGPLAIHFRRDHGGKCDKVNIGTWSWPEYQYTERGDTRKTRVSPNDLYDPKESSPSISCSISRGADAIVKDIKRRFLPDYERIYARCKAKADASQQYADKSKASWEAISAVIGKNPKHSSHQVLGTALGYYHFTVENRSGSARVELDNVSPAQLAAIIAVLKPTA